MEIYLKNKINYRLRIGMIFLHLIELILEKIILEKSKNEKVEETSLKLSCDK